VSTSLVLAFVLAAGAGKGPEIAWSKDYTRAFAEAEERRAPLLVHFRGANCGRTTVPGATESRGGSRGAGITRPLHDTELGDCDLMQQDVLENAVVVEMARRYVPVLVGPGDETLNTRYQVIVNPTTLFLDPWGNEIFRVSGYLERAKFSRILQAVPTDFAPLAAAGRALREKPDDVETLTAVAAFYESKGLRQVSERLYERALAGPPADLPARRQTAIARGLNLLLMGKAKEAGSVFAKALAEAPDGPGSDALLLGIVNAELEAGRRKEAEASYRRLQQAFPASPYTARAKQNLEAAKK
jgi:tetratricopeptide (TPR) repeat protein